MLSRRGLRIKTMQVLYMSMQLGNTNTTEAVKLLDASIYNAFRALLYNLYFLTQLAERVEAEANRKRNKFLPTQDDLKFSTVFTRNYIIDFLNKDAFFQQKLRKEKLMTLLDEEIVNLIYGQLKQSDWYLKYIAKEDHTQQEQYAAIQNCLHKFLFLNEYFDQHMEDIIPTWNDDEFIVSELMVEVLKAIPFNSTDKPDLFEFKITTEEKNFSNQLLIKTMLEDERFDKMVEAKLENWELDRISMIDRILMKMAITEFIHLSTIPVKVTINEYLDISKIYSTPKSKEFINGVLDKIMTELRSSGEIIKTGRGLVE